MELEEMTAFFTSRLDLYDEHMLREVPGCRAGYARMAALLPEGTARLLDLGCGTGLELEPIFARFPALRVTGVDLTAAMLDRLRAKFPDRDLTLIRPMLLATEAEVKAAVYEEGLPIVKSRCPADGATTREATKDFVRERCRTDHAFRQKTLHALQDSGIDGWRPLHVGRGSFQIPQD